MRKNRPLKSWLLLGLGILGIAAFVATLHIISPTIPGPTGQTIRNNIENDIEAAAMVYTDSGDVKDYLDAQDGKYRLKLERF